MKQIRGVLVFINFRQKESSVIAITLVMKAFLKLLSD